MSTLRSRHPTTATTPSSSSTHPTTTGGGRTQPTLRHKGSFTGGGSKPLLTIIGGSILIFMGTTLLQTDLLERSGHGTATGVGGLRHSQLMTPPQQQQQHPSVSKSLFQSIAHQVEKRNRKGEVLHKSITAVKKEDLKGLVDDEILNDPHLDEMTYEQAIQGREHLVNILHDAGVQDLDVATILSLPKWSSVTRLYGEGPVVIGLDTCQRFRDTIPLDDASVGTAGMFNTGTNPFAMYLEANCIMPHNTHDKHGGMRWQVPWGKHTLASRKWTNTAGHDERVNKTNVLPIAIVRDPYSWMQSMCKHPYAAKWHHTRKHCPNLVPNANDLANAPELGQNKTVPVIVNYKPPEHYDSLAHFWTAWYQEYLNADYPRLLVRFEDLQFHARELVDLVCQCAGATARNDDSSFTYIVDSGKWGPGHRGKQTNLISAMIKYGNDKKRTVGMTPDDLELAAQALDPELMQLFQYTMPAI